MRGEEGRGRRTSPDLPSAMKGRVLIIAGSDSGGGAGIQADIKAVTALGGFAMTAVTALTAQNTLGVHGVMGVPPDFIRQQIAVVLDDLGADALKTGMLHSVPVIEAACRAGTWASAGASRRLGTELASQPAASMPPQAASMRHEAPVSARTPKAEQRPAQPASTDSNGSEEPGAIHSSFTQRNSTADRTSVHALHGRLIG